MKRIHAPRGKLNVGDKQETVLIEGDVKLRLHNRFIYVGVDINIYALFTGGRSSYPPVLVKLLLSLGMRRVFSHFYPGKSYNDHFGVK